MKVLLKHIAIKNFQVSGKYTSNWLVTYLLLFKLIL